MRDADRVLFLSFLTFGHLSVPIPFDGDVTIVSEVWFDTFVRGYIAIPVHLTSVREEVPSFAMAWYAKSDYCP